MNANQQPNYRFYATLLDAYWGYASCEEVWLQYWGNSETPTKSVEQYKEEQFNGLIDRINRVPFDSEAADRGTVFNEVVDMIILAQSTSDKITAKSDKERGVIIAKLNVRPERVFEFPTALCQEFAAYYKGATPQVYTEAILPTSKGNVLLYGYIDELMPDSVHDIKTTSAYCVGKFRSHYQHRVYPYCLEQQGMSISQFEYNVAEFNKNGAISTFTEQYIYRAERDTAALQAICEDIIAFIESNRSLIVNTRIFNQ